MKCPKCGEYIEIDAELEEWVDNHSSEVPQGEPAILNCMCKKCGAGGIWLEMIPYGETSDVSSPVGVVKMPKLGINYGPEDAEIQVPDNASVRVDEPKENGQDKK